MQAWNTLEGQLGSPQPQEPGPGLQRKWFSSRLAKSSKGSGKNRECRGKVGDPELLVCDAEDQKMSTHGDIV